MKFENEILFAMKNDAKAIKLRHEKKIDLLQTIFLGANSIHSFKDLLSTPSIFSDDKKKKKFNFINHFHFQNIY
jgi:hypothetical protein